MNEVIRETHETVGEAKVREIEPTVAPRSFLAQVIYLVLTVISALLAIRFVLSALGANKNNGFADFIYSLSNPLVRPFYGLFSNDFVYGNGTARFEYECIIALVVYSLIAFILVKVISLGKRNVKVISLGKRNVVA